MVDLPKTISAIQINKTGSHDVLEFKTDVPLPTLKQGQVLVKNSFIGVNFIDAYFRKGIYPAPSFPYTLGREASGIVAAIHQGDKHDFKVGDHVVYTHESAYATYTAVPVSSLVTVPPSIALEDAAAAPIQAWTAWTLLHESHEVKSGDWILITAAAGGVGQWLVRMAKFMGANVIGTCSTKKMDLVKGLGADHVIEYSKGEYKGKVLEITKGEGVVAVFDSVGKTTFDESLECVARKGSMVSFGNASGVVDPLSILRLSKRNVKLLRPTLMQYIVTREELENVASAVWDFMEKDKFKADIYKVYPLENAAQAQIDLEGRITTGKLLLKP